MSSRIGLTEVGLQERERPGVEPRRILVRDRLEAQGLREVKRRRLRVHFGRVHGVARGRRRPEERGARQDDGENEREGRPDECEGSSHEDCEG